MRKLERLEFGRLEFYGSIKDGRIGRKIYGRSWKTRVTTIRGRGFMTADKAVMKSARFLERDTTT